MENKMTLYKINVHDVDVYVVEVMHRELAGVYYYSQLNDAFHRMQALYYGLRDINIVNDRIYHNNLNDYLKDSPCLYSSLKNKQVYCCPLYSGKEIK